MDLRNALSLAAVAGALYGDEEDAFSPALLFNTDATSLYLEDKIPKACVRTDSLAALKSERKSVGVTKDTNQRRTVSIIATTNAEGDLMSAIVVIKDSLVPKHQLEAVCMDTMGVDVILVVGCRERVLSALGGLEIKDSGKFNGCCYPGRHRPISTRRERKSAAAHRAIPCHTC